MSVDQKSLSDFRSIFDHADPRTSDYFLMKSPLHILAVLTFYVLFIFKVGPSVMRSRPPMKLDRVIMIYNWVQIILNGTIFILALKELPKMSLLCSPMDRSNSPHAITIANLQYYYFLLKVLDLLDTIFFVLRKKYSQVTFLHLYHHIVMVAGTWVSCRYFIGGQVYFMGVANLFVHVVMYFYYYVAIWNPESSIWWKKYITQLQIAQHCFVSIAFLLPLFNPTCSYPKPLLGVYLVQGVMFIYMFTDFYVRKYVKVKRKEE